MERHYLAQTTGTGAVFTFFLLVTTWVFFPEVVRDFIYWITATPTDTRLHVPPSSTFLVVGFGAIQPVIGVIIDSLWLPFANRFQYDESSRRLFQDICRSKRERYKDALEEIGKLGPEHVQNIKKRLESSSVYKDYKGLLGKFFYCLEVFFSCDLETKEIQIAPDIDFVVHKYQDKRATELKEWGRRQMAQVYWAENWAVAAFLGFLVGGCCSLYLHLRPEWPYTLLILLLAVRIWIRIMMVVRFTMKKRENDMVLLWVLESVSKDKGSGDILKKRPSELRLTITGEDEKT